MNALDAVLRLVDAVVHHGKNDEGHQPHLPAVNLDPNDAMCELLFQKIKPYNHILSLDSLSMPFNPRRSPPPDAKMDMTSEERDERTIFILQVFINFLALI
jgi:hypothetical protein